MDGDHFQPSGFGVGGAVTLAAGMAAATLAIGNNLAEVFAQAADDRDASRVNSAFADLLQVNSDLKESLEKERAANAAMFKQFSSILAVAMKQHRQLDALRAAGLVA